MIEPCSEHKWYDPKGGKPACGWERFTDAEAKDVEYGCTEPCAYDCIVCWMSYAIHLESDKEDLDWLDEHMRDLVKHDPITGDAIHATVWGYLYEELMGFKYALRIRDAISRLRKI